MDKTTQERIKAEADQHVKGLSIQHSKAHQHAGYIAGATAENERAQVLIDALEWIKTFGPDLAIKFIDKALSEWKDGKGKEVDIKPDKIESCGNCGKQPAKNYIGSQCYLCDQCMQEHSESLYD